MMPPPLRTTALFLALSTSLLPALLPEAQAASADAAELEGYLKERYYEVEFFVFERPDVLDFASEEILTVDRPRALPNSVRTQRLTADSLWTAPIDPLTRACLTFPTLSYELLPLAASGEALSDNEALTGFPDADEVESSEPGLPVPAIEPVLESDPQLDFLAEMAEFERTLADASQLWQPPENFRLRREANRIERRGLGRILFHGRWLQAVPAREAPDPVLVTGGLPLSDAALDHELVGSVGVTLGRFLHFKADLFFHGPGLGLEPTEAAMDASGASLLLASAAETAATGAGYMQLSESRRMRSEELHYLDHPKLGLVVRIDPVIFPASLIEALGNLESLEESTD